MVHLQHSKRFDLPEIEINESFYNMIPQVGIDMIEDAGHEVTIFPPEKTPIPHHLLIEACQNHNALLIAGFARLMKHFFSNAPV